MITWSLTDSGDKQSIFGKKKFNIGGGEMSSSIYNIFNGLSGTNLIGTNQ